MTNFNQQINQPLDLNQLNNLLAYIPSDTDRTEWVNNLMAIKSEFLDTAKDTAQNWSSAASNYNYKAFNSTWQSIKVNGGITIATLVKKAIDNGFRFEPITNQDRQKLEKERRERKAKAQRLAIEQAKEQVIQYQRAGLTANHIINNSVIADSNHPYLVSKNIQGHGVLFSSVLSSKDALIIPIFGTQAPFVNQVQSIQFINPDGSKRFMAGGKKAGGYYPIQWIDDAPIVICEGFATGATLAEHYAPFSSVICAFDSGNLEAVARWFRVNYPIHQIIIAGDNDHQSHTNTGRKTAVRVASLINAMISIPEFDGMEDGTDWNDRRNLDQQYKQITKTGQGQSLGGDL